MCLCVVWLSWFSDLVEQLKELVIERLNISGSKRKSDLHSDEDSDREFARLEHFSVISVPVSSEPDSDSTAFSLDLNKSLLSNELFSDI